MVDRVHRPDARPCRRDDVRRVCEHVFVRWDNLTIDEDEGTRLPGYRDPATDPPLRRTGGARHALLRDPREVGDQPRAEGVADAVSLDDQPVPGLHPCLYLLPSGRHADPDGGRKPPAAGPLRIGDEIYGTERRGRYRRYVRTRVLDHWASIKPAYRVTSSRTARSSSPAAITASSRERGWKHVTGPQQGRERRPHLTIGSSLLGTGAFADGPAAQHDYERGYLCGMVRGDGEPRDVHVRPGEAQVARGRAPIQAGARATARRCSARIATSSRTACTRPRSRFTPALTARGRRGRSGRSRGRSATASRN